jgi:hypothetical protein
VLGTGAAVVTGVSGTGVLGIGVLLESKVDPSARPNLMLEKATFAGYWYPLAPLWLKPAA